MKHKKHKSYTETQANKGLTMEHKQRSQNGTQANISLMLKHKQKKSNHDQTMEHNKLRHIKTQTIHKFTRWDIKQTKVMHNRTQANTCQIFFNTNKNSLQRC